MKNFTGTNFKNWGGISVKPKNACFPTENTDLDFLFESKQTFTIRGQGKNYTDAGLNDENIVCNKGLGRILSFDEKTGLIRVQSGVALRDLLMLVIPRGWIVPTVPGTANISIGGMIASNVHGKNQFRVGSIADHVRQLTLRTPNNQRLICSPLLESELFNATVGGYGTTGMIEDVEIQLQKINTPYLFSSYIKTKSISEQIQIMESKRNQSDFTIGWLAHDALDGDRIHGLIEYAKYAEGYEKKDQKISLAAIPVPFVMPCSIVNSVTTKIFNQLTYSKSYPNDFPIHFYDFNFKLDKLKDWNRLYGPKGFIQYQCLIPKSDQLAANVQHVLQYLKDNDVMTSLAVLKMHKTDAYGNFSFSKDGVSLAMDFSYSDRTVEILKNLTPWVIDIGGRLYLTKDRTMDCHQFGKMYARPLELQRRVLEKIDSNKKMDSLFMHRLKLRN